MFESIFGKSKRKALGQARATQFREAWLLANRSVLAAKTMQVDEASEFENMTVVDIARQFIGEQKETFSAETHAVEQLTSRMLPVVEDMYSMANRFRDEADVSSLHNSSVTRILELVTKQVAAGQKVSSIEAPDDFTENEKKILNRVRMVIKKYWEAE